MANTIETGKIAEHTARDFLQQKGLTLVEANYHCPRGEIDLIMKDAETTVFVEVRYRHTTRFGSGAETVDRHKQQKLLASAAHYLQRNSHLAEGACRFDVISLSSEYGTRQLEWISNAFGIN